MEQESARLALSSDTVHLWVVPLSYAADRELLSRYERLLSSDERRSRDRFRFPENRLQHLVTRVLVRLTLSQYFDRDPDWWRFTVNSHGKPEISAELGAPPIRFNASHTTNLVACGFALRHPIGVDVEFLARRGATTAIAKRHFSPAEVKELQSHPERNRRRRFFDYWTLKEAYIKARGLGLALPLKQFTFEIPELGAPRVSFAPQLSDEPSAWRFWRFQPTADHAAAVAVRCGAQRHINLKIFKGAPLLGWRTIEPDF